MSGRILFCAVLLVASVSACAQWKGESAAIRREPPTWDVLRESMVRDQIEARGVEDARVLGAMRKVPRHLFVPEASRARAYDDTPLPIGEGQTISQPYIVALMTSLLDPGPGDRVLEVGTGSGYQAAVLAEIVDSVYTIEILEPLAERARRTLDSLGYARVVVKAGDGYAGWEEHAPFDGILVTCAPRDIPPPLLDQLAEGGRMAIPAGEFGDQELLLVEKRGGEIHRRSVLPVRFVPLTGPHGEE